MSSSFCQVIVVPAFTMSRGGLKVKLSIITIVSADQAGAAANRLAAKQASWSVAAPFAAAPALRRKPFFMFFLFLSALQCGIHNGEALLARPESDARNAEHGTQPAVIDFHRPG